MTSKEIDEFHRLSLIAAIKKFGDKYSDEELKGKDKETLEVILDSISKYVDILDGILEEDDNKYLKEHDKSNLTQEDYDYLDKYGAEDKEIPKEEEKIDFTDAFADVAKEFDMDNFEIKMRYK